MPTLCAHLAIDAPVTVQTTNCAACFARSLCAGVGYDHGDRYERLHVAPWCQTKASVLDMLARLRSVTSAAHLHQVALQSRTHDKSSLCVWSRRCGRGGWKA